MKKCKNLNEKQNFQYSKSKTLRDILGFMSFMSYLWFGIRSHVRKIWTLITLNINYNDINYNDKGVNLL